MTESANIDELIRAAFEVATYPTVGAYRSGGYDKKVGRSELDRLLKALLPVVNDRAHDSLRRRIDATGKFAADIVRNREQSKQDAIDRAAEIAANRHPYVPAGFQGYRCEVCTFSKGDPRHHDENGEEL